MLPANSSASYLAFSSRDDATQADSKFNPADFTIVVPNSIKCQNVIRVCVTAISIPRMFQTINEFNNTLIWWQRQVIEIPAPPVTDRWLRTVSLDWTPRAILTIPPGILNMTQILTYINANNGLPLNETWTYDVDNRTVKIHVVPPGVVLPFGYFIDHAHVPPAVSYANMAYLTDGKSEFFDTMGLQKAADIASEAFENYALDLLDPNTFGSVGNSNLARATSLPMFDLSLFNYASWATIDYDTPTMNPPDISGPQLIHVCVSDLADGNTTYAATGSTYDVLTSVFMGDAPWGENSTKEVKDGEYEAIGVKSPRNITQLRIRLLDDKFRPTVLPRNYIVPLRMQLVTSER